jgi:palmitoyltransferase
MLKQSQPASSKNGSFIISIEGNQTGKNVAGSNATYWSKLVAELYPPGSAVR